MRGSGGVQHVQPGECRCGLRQSSNAVRRCSSLSVQQPASARTWSSNRGLLRCCSLGRPLMGVPASRSARRGRGEQGTLASASGGACTAVCRARSQTHAHGAAGTRRATCTSCAAQQGTSRQRGTRTECRDGWLAVCPSAARCAAAAAGLQPVRLSATVHTGAAAAGWPAHSGMRASDWSLQINCITSRQGAQLGGGPASRPHRGPRDHRPRDRTLTHEPGRGCAPGGLGEAEGGRGAGRGRCGQGVQAAKAGGVLGAGRGEVGEPRQDGGEGGGGGDLRGDTPERREPGPGGRLRGAPARAQPPGSPPGAGPGSPAAVFESAGATWLRAPWATAPPASGLERRSRPGRRGCGRAGGLRRTGEPGAGAGSRHRGAGEARGLSSWCQ